MNWVEIRVVRGRIQLQTRVAGHFLYLTFCLAAELSTDGGEGTNTALALVRSCSLCSSLQNDHELRRDWFGHVSLVAASQEGRCGVQKQMKNMTWQNERLVVVMVIASNCKALVWAMHCQPSYSKHLHCTIPLLHTVCRLLEDGGRRTAQH
jgi:hypothetical protein